jgi:hypothetical protein
MSRLLRPAALLAALFLGAEAGAQTLDAGRAALLEAEARSLSAEGEPEGKAFRDALGSALEGEAASRGLAVSRADFGETASEPQAVLAAAAGSGARWVLVARASVEAGGRVSWRASIYDGRGGGLLGSDAFSAYAGLSALPLIEASARQVFEAAWLAKEGEERPLPIGWPLRFSSGTEGALVSLGEELPLGAVRDGALTAPYLPLLPGTRLALSQERPGYWARSDRLKVPNSEAPIVLPPLYRKTGSALSLDYGLGRLLGLQASYRYYPLPDLLYLRASEALWAAYDFLPGSSPVYHAETRLGAAFSPFFSPSAPLRVSIGSGASGILTHVARENFEAPLFLDLLIEPIFFTIELHFPERAFFIEGRFPYSLGADSGLLTQGWVHVGGGAPLFSAGVLWKW